MEKNLLTRENFKCDRYCGECCKKLLVGLTNSDVKRIEKLGLKKDDFIEKDYFTPKRLFLKKQKNGWCVFLKKSKGGKYSCSIYSRRPEMCREYPFFKDAPEQIKSCLPKSLYPNVFFSLKK